MKTAILTLLILAAAPAQAELKLSSGKGGNFIFERDPKALASSVQIVFRTGSMSDPKGKEGLAKVSFEALFRGTKQKTRVEFYSQLERLGAQIDTNTASNRTIISLDTINESLESTMALLSEAILQPGLKDSDIKSLIEEDLAALNQEKSSNRALLKRTVQQALYKGTPLAFPDDGTIESISSITPADIKNFLEKATVSGNIIVAATSNRPEREIKSIVEKSFQSFPNGKKPDSPKLSGEKIKGRHLYLVGRKGSSTTEMAIAHQGIAANEKDRDILELGLFIFGADFTSRLPTVLRKENGWTYGAYANYSMIEKPRSHGGSFMIYAFPQAQFTDKTTLKALELYEDYIKNGITSKELKFAQKSLGNSYPFEFASSKTRLVSRLYERLDGAPFLSVPAFQKKINSLNPSIVRTAIQKVHEDKNLVIVLVGDPEKIQPLAKLIPNITTVTEVEDPMKSF